MRLGRRRPLARALVLLPALAGVAPVAQAEAWRLTGSNTLRLETYHASGDEDKSPYADRGTFYVNDLNLSLSGDSAPGKSWRIDFAGALTDSPYRSKFGGFVPEVVRISHENRNATLPFRIDLGDQEVALSPMTMQRYLKAGRITLQPDSYRDGRKYSVTAFIGADQPHWRDFDASEDAYQGLGLHMQDSKLGNYGLNIVRNSRDGGGPVEGSQWVASATGFKGFTLGSQQLELSGELAYLRGEVSTAKGSERREGHGLNLQLDGKHQSRPLDYRLRYDRYSRDFRSRGGNVPADNRAMAAEAGWNFDSGVQLRGRLQRIEDRVSSGNRLRTDAAGASVAGPLRKSRPQAASGKLDLQVQRRGNARGTVKARSVDVQAGVMLNHSDKHQTQVDVGLTHIDDRTRADADRISKRVAVTHRAKVSVKGLDLTLAPGVAYQEARSRRGEASFGPSLELEARKDNHRLTVQVGSSSFDAEDSTRSVDHERVSVGYEYRRGQHSFGANIERSLRDPAEGESTESWRGGVYWRYDFDKTLSR